MPLQAEGRRLQTGNEASAEDRRKRVMAQTEPEYFPAKRNLEDLWQQVFPFGTEWDQLDSIYQYKWNFSNLEDALEVNGELYNKKVYLFGYAERNSTGLFSWSRKSYHDPCCCSCGIGVSPFPPSDKIGLPLVDEILHMKQMKMDWVPYIPFEKRESQVERVKTRIFILRCTQRRTAIKLMKTDRLKMFEYCIPYFYNPLLDDKIEQRTEVRIFFPADPAPVISSFDWEIDVLEDFADHENLPADQKEPFKDFVKQKVREAKRANREEREARRRALAEIDEETKAAFKNMRFYKFYPVSTSDTPDVLAKSPVINRYYGMAHKVM